MESDRPTTQSPGGGLAGKLAIILFVVSLLSFVTESQLTQYVQTSVGYRQPFFLFYIVHSSFIVMFPLHLIYLVVVTKRPPSHFIAGIRQALVNQLAPTPSRILDPVHTAPFPTRRLVKLVLMLTMGITAPALLWFIAVSLSAISDVTALWNTNAFFAYIFTVKIFRLNWESRKLAAVTAATVGAAAVVYGGSTSEPSDTSDPQPQDNILALALPSSPLLGDLLTLFASIGYGLYQVLYKKYVALPSDPEFELVDEYDRLPIASQDVEDDALEDTPLGPASQDSVYPPPFGLYANFFTSAIGLCTLAVLWIPIPILHYLDMERFKLPGNLFTIGIIACIAATGVLFNGGLMILLGIWGPIITSVGNLMTIVLVFISDIIWGGAVQTVTIWSAIGASIIVGAFGVLVYDMGKSARE
ncbi:hypothetical protein GLOTRDRAFT_68491 [Gloeophyllum trabeum ATCC 11539]|uniref:EamA domain-containing protein n=1 Tax=Gloeophyllum trabeum (strain ATCC 11539 / FP-39264 / Madison 617) TaxID=670483 RepID=S7QMH9_GLOTA|nr:uncharacterized protein GLOTRDRAFT_68491 [Gloeophyllum trabeum ATCC 11539]EPQ60658.1 hypothetical protein GLOTRDRAFT_68491 [Gloeophyllum trabeum ATCC 11539]